MKRIWIAILLTALLALSACSRPAPTGEPVDTAEPLETEPYPGPDLTAESPTESPYPAPELTQEPSTQEPYPAPSEDTAGSDRQVILDAFAAQNTMSYRATSTILLADSGSTEGGNHSTVVEFIPPFTYHINSDGTEYIVTSDAVYNLDEDENWTKMEVDPAAIVNNALLDQVSSSITNIQHLGKETFNGVNVDVYDFQFTSPNGSPNSMKMWIGEDGLPYQQVIEGSVVSLDNATGKQKDVPATTTTVIVYDEGITIDVP